MKIDNFTTARCNKCGWLRQFHPGKEYAQEDFKCQCVAKEIKPKTGALSGKPSQTTNKAN